MPFQNLQMRLSARPKEACHGFTQVPNFILTKKELSFCAKLAYAMLLKYAWADDACLPGQFHAEMDARWSLKPRNSFHLDMILPLSVKLNDSAVLAFRARGRAR